MFQRLSRSPSIGVCVMGVMFAYCPQSCCLSQPRWAGCKMMNVSSTLTWLIAQEDYLHAVAVKASSHVWNFVVLCHWYCGKEKTICGRVLAVISWICCEESSIVKTCIDFSFVTDNWRGDKLWVRTELVAPCPTRECVQFPDQVLP
jgi:hypothetical protein